MTPWDELAPLRERHRAWIDAARTPVTNWLVEALAVEAMETVLELAAGAGGVGFAILERADRGVRLISSDVSAATLDVARGAAAERGLTGVEFRAIDAQAIDLASASVDSVVCRWGYMLMDDPLGALRETHRVLRAGGRVALSVWSAAARNPWTTIDAQVCERLGYEARAAPTDPGQMFSMADPERLRATVTQSGLVVRRLEKVGVTWPYDSADDYVAIEIDRPGPRGEFFRGLPPIESGRAISIAAELLEPFRTDDGYVVPGETLNVLASRNDRASPEQDAELADRLGSEQ